MRLLGIAEVLQMKQDFLITDYPGMLLAEGHTVDAITCLDQGETLSVNTP